MKLNVSVIMDDGGVFAQGVEIDYASSAPTCKECIANFCKGLKLTADEYMKVHGSVDRLLSRRTPEEHLPLNFWSGFHGARAIQAGPVEITALFRGYTDGT